MGNGTQHGSLGHAIASFRAQLADVAAKASAAIAAATSAQNRAASPTGAGTNCPAGVATIITSTPAITPKISGKFRITGFVYGHPNAGGMSGLSIGVGTGVGGGFAALFAPFTPAGVVAATAATSSVGGGFEYEMTAAQALPLGTPVQFSISGGAVGDQFNPVSSYILVEELPN